ncbi:MAG: hypothetical protein EOM50_21205, partial [Erysipelotrichia bacterium]|nr:hypothetical protein [Erysipelotrichia bacterium]
MYDKLFNDTLYAQEAALFQYGNHICIDNGSTRVCHCGNMIFKKSHFVCSECGTEVIYCDDGKMLMLTSPFIHEKTHHLFLQKCYSVELLQESPSTHALPYINKIVELSFDYITLLCSFSEIEGAKIKYHKTVHLMDLINDLSDQTEEYYSLEDKLLTIMNKFPQSHFDFKKGICTVSKELTVSHSIFLKWFLYLLKNAFYYFNIKNDNFVLSQIVFQHIKLQTTIFDECDNIIIFPESLYTNKSYLKYTKIEDFLEREIVSNTTFQPLWLWFLMYSKTHEMCRLDIMYHVCILFETAEWSLKALDIIIKNDYEEKFLEIKAILVSLKKLKSIQWVINHLWEFFTYDKLDDLCWLYKLQLSEKTFLIPFFEDIETLYAYLKALDKAEDVSHRWIFKTMLA